VIVDVRFFGVIALLVLPTVVVAVPGGSMLEVITEIPTVMVADMPMVVPMLGRRMSMLGFLPLAFGALPHGGHHGASFRVKGCLENPA